MKRLIVPVAVLAAMSSVVAGYVLADADMNARSAPVCVRYMKTITFIRQQEGTIEWAIMQRRATLKKISDTRKSLYGASDTELNNLLAQTVGSRRMVAGRVSYEEAIRYALAVRRQGQGPVRSDPLIAEEKRVLMEIGEFQHRGNENARIAATVRDTMNGRGCSGASRPAFANGEQSARDASAETNDQPAAPAPKD